MVGRFRVRNPKSLKLRTAACGIDLASFPAQGLVIMDHRYGKRANQMKARRRKPTSNSSPTPSRMKRLTLDLHEPLHRAIKKNAAEEGVTMAQKLRTLLSKHYRSPEETPSRARASSFSRSI